MKCQMSSLQGISLPCWYKISGWKRKLTYARVPIALAFACGARPEMPTYVYKCADNGHVFDLIQGFGDEPGANCPTCGSASTRQITVPTVIYKGSGFYTTDYGSGSSSKNGRPSDNKPETGSESGSGSGSSSKSESGSSSSSSSSSKRKSSGSSSSSGDGHSNGGTSHSHGAGSHTH